MHCNSWPLLAPMLATPASSLPSDTSGYACEVKWDGIRAMYYIAHNQLRIMSRNGNDITTRYPELRGLATVVPHEVVLDGEIVAFTSAGKPSFSLLQHRINQDTPDIARLRTPVTYVIFDMVYLDGRLLLSHSYQERRKKLASLQLAGPFWMTPAYQTGNAAAFLAASRTLQLEGILLKRVDSIYLPGKRSDAWLKIKNLQRQEFVIGGWSQGKGARSGTIGSLLLGYYDIKPDGAQQSGTHQQFLYAGSCGTGFTQESLVNLKKLLQPLVTDSNPFHIIPPKKSVVFVRPELVGEFSFTEWTDNRTLRHPSFQGLRFDKDPLSVIKET